MEQESSKKTVASYKDFRHTLLLSGRFGKNVRLGNEIKCALIMTRARDLVLLAYPSNRWSALL